MVGNGIYSGGTTPDFHRIPFTIEQIWNIFGNCLCPDYFNFAVRFIIITLQQGTRRNGGTMSTATMSSKGQVTIPTLVRVALGIGAGDRVEFVQVEPGRFEIIAATRSVIALKGMIRKPAFPVTIKAMNEAIVTKGAKAR